MQERTGRHCLAAGTAPVEFLHADSLIAAHSQSQAFEPPG